MCEFSFSIFTSVNLICELSKNSSVIYAVAGTALFLTVQKMKIFLLEIVDFTKIGFGEIRVVFLDV